jgi:hypothetical protein
LALSLFTLDVPDPVEMHRCSTSFQEVECVILAVASMDNLRPILGGREETPGINPFLTQDSFPYLRLFHLQILAFYFNADTIIIPADVCQHTFPMIMRTKQF